MNTLLCFLCMQFVCIHSTLNIKIQVPFKQAPFKNGFKNLMCRYNMGTVIKLFLNAGLSHKERELVDVFQCDACASCHTM